MNILVTGASKGIGRAICESLEGNVFRASRSLVDSANTCSCDLASLDGIVKLGSFIEKNKIDVLVNNAGEYIYCPVESISMDNLEHIIRLNLEAPLYLISKAVPYMKSKGWGRVVNIGSISGVMGEANASMYSASKSGLIGVSKALGLELAEFGITVNTINPGWVDTDMGNSSVKEGEFTKEEVIECIPQRRFVSPFEIAGMVKYLISDDAKGVTGQSINLCAGLSVGY